MNGIIVVNKEKDYTSRDVVNIISKILGTKKVGHTGTLDPIAEGVLVVCIGKCTKLCEMLTSEYKEYIAEFKLGYETDTLDEFGKIVKKSRKIVDKDTIKSVINSFIKEYDQIVPIYSSVKVNGKKLYEYARNNQEVSLPSRKVNIKNIEILKICDVIRIKTMVSKGTYIRSLIRDIGEVLGTYATMTKLTRISQGKYTIDNAYTINDIKNSNYKLISIEEIFDDYKKVYVDKDLYKKISNGVILDNIYDSEYVLFYYNNNLISIYKEFEKSKLKLFIKI